MASTQKPRRLRVVALLRPAPRGAGALQFLDDGFGFAVRLVDRHHGILCAFIGHNSWFFISQPLVPSLIDSNRSPFHVEPLLHL